MKSDNQSLTVYDIARMAGVSPATVSKVINRRRGVNAETAAKVIDILASTGFAPRWKAGSSKVIGIVCPPYDGVLLDSYDSQIISRCFDALRKKEYSLELISHVPAARKKNVRSLFASHENLSGLIAIASPPNYPCCLDILANQTSIPGVVIGKLADCQPNSIPAAGNHIWADDYAAGYQLATLFLRHNHKTFLLVTASLDDIGHNHRLKGIMAALKAEKIPDHAITIQEVKEDLRKNGNQIAMTMVCSKKKPSAVIFTNGAICAGFVIGCVNMKIQIPAEFSVAGFEDASELEHLPIPVTAMHTPAEHLGAAAVTSLLSQLEHHTLPMARVLQHQLCIRSSVAIC